jgi:autophagy-related protein 101
MSRSNNGEQVFDLKEFTLRSSGLREGLSCLLNTILFHRALGVVEPEEVECQAFPSLCYVRVADTKLERRVADGIESFCANFGNSGAIKSVLSLTFFAEKESKSFFGSQHQRVAWETWHLPVRIVLDNDMDSATAERMIRTRMTDILAIVNQNRSSIPPVDQAAASRREQPSPLTFPFEISRAMAPDSKSSNVWWDALFGSSLQ